MTSGVSHRGPLAVPSVPGLDAAASADSRTERSRVVPTRVGPLVVALGHHAGRGALRLAWRLARRDGTRAQVAAIMSPLPLDLADGDDAERAHEQGRRLLLRRERLQRQVHDVLGRAAHVGATVAVAESARAFAEIAHERRADRILVGLDETDAPDRTRAGEVALLLARTAHVPVLAVAGDGAELPERAVVAVTGGAASLVAARAAAGLLGPGATLTLVHVLPTADERAPHRAPQLGRLLSDANERIAWLASELQAAGDLVVRTAWLEGEPAAALLAYTDAQRADLLACGLDAAVPKDDVLASSVPARLLAAARCTVVVARPIQRPHPEARSA